jgi:hypothetical protein
VIQTDPQGTCAGANPAYDPRLAELQALERIYEGSPGLQQLTQAHQSGDWQDTVRARQALEQETGFTVVPWTGPVNGRSPTPNDAGMVDWENRRIYVDPSVDEEAYREALGHEFGAVKVINDDAAQRGVTPTGDWEAIKEEHIPAAARPNIITPYRTQVLDQYVRDPEGMTENLERDRDDP